MHLRLSSSHGLQNFSVLNKMQAMGEIDVNRSRKEAPHNAVRWCGDPPFYEWVHHFNWFYHIFVPILATLGRVSHFV